MTRIATRHIDIVFRGVAFASLLVAGLGLLAGCGASLLPKPAPPAALFALDDAGPFAVPIAVPFAAVSLPQPGASAPTLLVSTPRAAAGYDSSHIVYQRQAHGIEYFAVNQWVDTPAQMLAPLMVRSIERSGAFRAVLHAPAGVAGELRLDTEIVRLQQEFGNPPSRVRLTMRAVLVDTATRRVVASREFEAVVAASSDDPYGGVVAANGAVQQVLTELARFCAGLVVR